MTGKITKEELLEFGESILYRAYRGIEGKLAPRWHAGVWLGRKWGTLEHYIGTEDGVISCRAVQRRKSDERWRKDSTMAVQGTPWSPKPSEAEKKDPEIYFPEDMDGEAPKAIQDNFNPDTAARPRRMKNCVKDLRKYGFTKGCSRCEGASAGRQTDKTHSEACRQRIERAMKEDDVDKERLAEATYRLDKCAYDLTKGDHDGQKKESDGAARGSRDPAPDLRGTLYR